MNLDRDLFLSADGQLCDSTHPQLAKLVGLRGAVLRDELARELKVAEYLAAHPLPPRPVMPAAEPAAAEDEPPPEAKALDQATVEDKALAQAATEDKPAHAGSFHIPPEARRVGRTESRRGG
jgi:hypothetical protein